MHNKYNMLYNIYLINIIICISNSIFAFYIIQLLDKNFLNNNKYP